MSESEASEEKNQMSESEASESEASETGNVSDFSHSSSSKTLSVRKQVQHITFLFIISEFNHLLNPSF